MRLFEPVKPNLEYVLWSLLKHLKINVTSKATSACLTDHPDYPSVLAMSDCLQDWNIPHQLLQLNKETYDANLLPFPLIAHLSEQGGRFILINKISNGIVSYSDENKNAEMIENDFLKRWDGFILYAENDDDCGEKNYTQNRIKHVFQSLIIPTLIILIVGIIVAILAKQPFSWHYLSLCILKIIGTGVCTLLLIQSINSNNPLIQNLCGLAGKNDCNAILKSNAAKITSWLSWSEVGFFYFAGTLLSLLLDPSSLLLISLLSLCALPYIVYSISFQYRAKNWCILCCIVQSILLVEALVFNYQSLNFSRLSFSFGLTAISFLLPILTWSFLKPFFLQAVQQTLLKQQLKKFKYNGELFNQSLKNQPRYSVGEELMPIILGNPEAETIITVVSNPFCSPCAKAHQTIDEWLKTRDDLQLKLIFTTANHDDDNRTKVAQHAMALSLLKDKNIVENALNDWYALSNKNYEDWAIKYPLSYNGEVSKAAEHQKKWCEMAEITFTPTILVNGYKLPQPYILEDIKYLIA